MTVEVAPELNSLKAVSVPLMNGTCPKCRGKDARLEAVGAVVDIVHDRCTYGRTYRVYVGPVSGLPASSPLALELALSR